MILRGAVGRLRAPRPRLIVVTTLIAIVLAGGWLWLRDSSLVAVQRVSVSGQSGADAARIARALSTAARAMTTLDVDLSKLRRVLAPYPVVKDVSVSTHFPHAMGVRVIEQIPVGAIAVGGRTTAVAGDGTLLHDVSSRTLPAIPVRVPPGGSRLTDPITLNAVAVLAAAPYQLLSHVSQVTAGASHGLVAQLRAGPSIYFGDAIRLQAKWSAASAVLADPGSAGAAYVDVTDPHRPAAGASTTPASAPSSPAPQGPAGTQGSASPYAPHSG